MNDKPQWTQAAKDLLDDGAQNFDAATLSRLNRARQNALAQRRKSVRWTVPAGLASACALLLAVAVWHGRAPPAPTDATVVDISASDNEALTDDDEFYEDLDFYAWLDAQNQEPQG
jgi:hypothetical protein